MKLLTTKEAAAQLRISMSTLRGWKKQGKGPKPIVLGPATIRYSEDDLHKFIESKIGQEQGANQKRVTRLVRGS